MADGAITYSTKLDNKELERQLAQETKHIEQLENKLLKNNNKRMPIAENVEELGVKLDAAKEKYASLQEEAQRVDAALTGANADDPASIVAYTESLARQKSLTKEITEQEKIVDKLQGQFDRSAQRLEAVDADAKRITTDLNAAKDKAGELSEKLYKPATAGDAMAQAVNRANEGIEKFSKRVSKLAKRVFVFTLITAALRQVKEYVWNAIQTNDEAMASIAKLKGALLTLAQPILNVVIPAFTELVRVVSSVVTALAKITAAIFGTTIQESAAAAENLYKEQKALKGVGSAAKKAGKSLAAFDEINVLSTSDSSAASGGASGGGIAPDFSGIISDQLSTIKELFTGAALLSLGAILAFSGVNVPTGLLLMGLGAAAIYGAVSADWTLVKSLMQGAMGDIITITSTILLMFGALLLFSGSNIGLGLGLLALGAAGLASVVTANWDTMKGVLTKSIGQVMAVVGASLLAIGTILAFSGVNVPLGIGLMVAGAASLAVGNALLNWDVISSNVRNAVGKLMQIIGSSLLVLGVLLALTGVNLPLGLGLMLAGSTALGVGTAVLNWDAIKDKIAGVWNSIKTWWNANCAKYFTAEYWKELGNAMIDGLLSGLTKAWEGVKDWARGAKNWITGLFSQKTGVAAPQIAGASVSAQSISFRIPALAQGAVIPPNRAFMAVLGDQKSGVNIETPLETMVQAFKTAINETGYGSERIIENVLLLDGEVIYRNQQKLARRRGINLAEG